MDRKSGKRGGAPNTSKPPRKNAAGAPTSVKAPGVVRVSTSKQEGRQLRGYWLAMLLLLALPIALLGQGYLLQAIAGSTLAAAFVLMLETGRVLKPWRKGPVRTVAAGLAGCAGVFAVAITMAAVYVARHGAAVMPAEGFWQQMTGVAYVLVAHIAARWMVIRLWPIPRGQAIRTVVKA